MSNALRAIACDLRRLRFDVNNPHRFFDERRRLTDILIEAASMPSCTTCPVRQLKAQLDAKGRQINYARRKREEAEARADQAERAREAAQRALDEAVRMLRQTPKPRRRRNVLVEGQLALFDGAA